jgi:hypothetical protein
VSFATARALYAWAPTTLGLLLALASASLVYIGTILALGGLVPRDRARLAALVRSQPRLGRVLARTLQRSRSPIGHSAPAPSPVPNSDQLPL